MICSTISTAAKSPAAKSPAAAAPAAATKAMLAGVLALVLSGCTSLAGGSQRTNGGAAVPTPPQGAFQSLPAPRPAGAAIEITRADEGKTVSVPVGAKVSVALVGVPTAGYLWGVAAAPEFLAKVETLGGPTIDAQRQPGFAGGNHWEVTVFEVKGPGKADLVFEQRRPWETDQPASATFRVTIDAR